MRHRLSLLILCAGSAIAGGCTSTGTAGPGPGASARAAPAASPLPAAHEPRWRRAARYSNEAVLPFYLLHEPVIVAAAYLIVRWHAPALVKYPALVAISFAATLAIYELAIRRYRPTRILFGMKARPPQVNDQTRQAPAASGDVAEPQAGSETAGPA